MAAYNGVIFFQPLQIGFLVVSLLGHLSGLREIAGGFRADHLDLEEMTQPGSAEKPHLPQVVKILHLWHKSNSMERELPQKSCDATTKQATLRQNEAPLDACCGFSKDWVGGSTWQNKTTQHHLQTWKATKNSCDIA